MCGRVETAIKRSEKKENQAPPVHAAGSSRSVNPSVEYFMHLQKTVGNHAVQRMLKSGDGQVRRKVDVPHNVEPVEARSAGRVTRMPEDNICSDAVRGRVIRGKPDAEVVRRLSSPGDIMKEVASSVICRPRGTLSIAKTERVGLPGSGYYGADFNHVFSGVPAGCSLRGFQVSEEVTTTRDDFRTGFPSVAVGTNIWNITSQNRLHRPDSIWSAAGPNGLGRNPVSRWPAVMESRQIWHLRSAANQLWQRGPAVTITVTASGNRQNRRAIIITTRDNGVSRSEPYTGPAISVQP